ncbi:hypothetical protein HUN01_26330 [Nostoc edaphicum CCNP1411]|uniref:Uncharacterized protein n=1 Tax=Nostoc edaphicum CCNP1411 TaxID=1472755 RepID=A0A7D7R7E9_9NOSO|nr:hypothetical protein [Nostoc edaphicum]QMS90926.1 hypothetical protein HUN01_26330 [Nostoc edaphicum CCNP1411]
MVFNGSPWALCSRNYLVRMIEAARREGLEIRAALSLGNLLFIRINH